VGASLYIQDPFLPDINLGVEIYIYIYMYMYIEKSHVYYLKSPVSVHRKEPCIYYQKSPASCQKSPVFFQYGTIHPNPFFPDINLGVGKPPVYILTKEPCVLPKEPCIYYQKSPVYTTKRALYTQPKEPCVLSKEPCILSIWHYPSKIPSFLTSTEM